MARYRLIDVIDGSPWEEGGPIHEGEESARKALDGWMNPDDKIGRTALGDLLIICPDGEPTDVMALRLADPPREEE